MPPQQHKLCVSSTIVWDSSRLQTLNSKQNRTPSTCMATHNREGSLRAAS